MGLMDAQDEIGRELQHKRDETKKVEQAKEDAKEEAKAEVQRHQENKEQGMI